jgi:polyisoprenyl-phosphate glycosyltransferase
LTDPKISIVSPVYKAELILDELHRRLSETIAPITPLYEIILVEDHSPDGSWRKIEELCVKYPEVKGIKLSRNFGQHSAIGAGLHHATGDYVIVMDCDLQDNPDYIPALIEKAENGYDVVYTLKKARKHNFIKDITAYAFHFVFNYLSGNKQVKTDGKVGSYSLITRKVAEAYRQLNDEYRPYLVMLNILGFNSTYQEIQHNPRFAGKSSYTFGRLMNHAMNGIISQSDRLLKLSIYVGALYMFFTFLFGIYILIKALNHTLMSGWPTVVVLMTFSTGVILLFLGIIGLYISRIFSQTKNRPLFIVDKKINF